MQWWTTEDSGYQSSSNAQTVCGVDRDYSKQVRVNPTEKERFENWFVTPLSKMGGDQSIICLMILFPLLERILRYDLQCSHRKALEFSENSKPLNLLAKLLRIPSKEARMFWDCFRNGLMHRAMIKNATPYILDPDQNADRAVVIENGVVRVHVWNLRDLVVDLVKKRGKRMWKDGTHPLPDVH